MRPPNFSLFFLVGAIVCFVVALLIVLGALNGNGPAWTAGGLLAFAASFLSA